MQKNNMQYPSEIAEFQEEGQSLDIKELLFNILDKWYWFVVCGLLAISLSWFYNSYLVSVWQVRSTILVSEGSKKPGIDNLFESLSLGTKVNMQNHIEILKSYNLNRQAIENLGWRTSWFEEGKFIDLEYYKNEPYRVTETKGWLNSTDIPIKIKVVSDDLFEVKCDYKGKIGNEAFNIYLDQQGKVGVPITSPYFCFTLERGTGFSKPGTDYYFKFNDMNKMTLSYIGKSSKLSVDLTDKTAEILQLTVKGTQPEREVDFLNELSKVYIQFGLREKNRTSENTVEFIESQLSGIADSLRIAGQSFTNFRSENQVLDLSKEGGLVLDKLNGLESDKANADMRLGYYRRLKSYITDASAMKQAVSPSVIGIVDPALNSLVAKLAELYNRREVLSYSAHDKNPALVMLDNEIISTRSSLGENLTNLESNAVIELENLKGRIKGVNKIVEQLPQTEQKFINFKRRFDVNNDLYTFLLTKRAEAAIIKASNVADSQVIDVARLETATIVGPNKMLNLLIGFILGLGTPLIVILLSDYFNDALKSREEIERLTSLPIVGEIGHNRYEKEFVTTEHPRSEISESFRGLRTSLQYILKGQDHNVIGIHSTIPGEGKSFISLNLASIIALNNKKVLLVATDMRKPRLNALLDADHQKVGLSTYLINRDTFSEIIIKTHIENLSFVPSGPIPPNPSELLESGGYERFINEAKSTFDYVIVDNAPVPVVTDGVITSRYCNANIFVVRQNYSHKEQVKYIEQLAAKEIMANVCIAINDIVVSGYGYKYGHGKYGYSKYGYSKYGYGRYGYGGYSGYYDDAHHPEGWEKVWSESKKKLKRIFKF